MGIDEAGRGPVLGSMVYGVAWCPANWLDELKALGFDDSKKLTEEQRQTMYRGIAEEPMIAAATDFLSARTISSQMLGTSRISLNQMAFQSTCRLIQSALDRGVKLTAVFVDTVGDADRYKERLSSEFPWVDFTVCPKADALYPIVSAASIVAKVERDQEITEAARAAGGEPTGSGYPSDPVTKAWLKAAVDPVFGFPALVRFSWQPAQTLMAAKCVSLSWEADDESLQLGQPSIATFAGGKRKGQRESSAMSRHSYFRARKLQRVQTW